VWSDVNAANLAAGLTAGLWYAFGAIPIQLSATEQLEVPPDIASSWFCVILVLRHLGHRRDREHPAHAEVPTAARDHVDDSRPRVPREHRRPLLAG
jgi:hypothetical protein